MKRLCSLTFIYLGIFFPPILSLGFIIIAFVAPKGAYMVFVLFAVFMALFWFFTFRRLKKIYYQRGVLYIYDIFSKKPVIVHKEDIGGITRILPYDPGYYKIVYYDDNKDAKSVHFRRNWFLSDFNDIIDKLNDI